MNHHQISLLLGTMLLSTTSCAEIYKCTAESGTVYSERPCAEDAEIVKIRDKRPELSESEMKVNRERQQEKARSYFNERKVQSLLKEALINAE
ncbi:MAG: DUF4124 domain-containing protein, partial [bacterium]